MATFFELYSVYIWFAAAVIFFVIEAASTGLISIWLAVAALITAIPAALNAPAALQITIFLVLSIVLIASTRRISKKLLTKNELVKNARSIVGKDAVVVEEINNLTGKGRIRVADVDWWAQSQGDEVIPVESIVTIDDLQGAKVIVSIKQSVYTNV